MAGIVEPVIKVLPRSVVGAVHQLLLRNHRLTTDYTIDFNTVTAKGDNHFGSIFQIVITVDENDTNHNNTINNNYNTNTNSNPNNNSNNNISPIYYIVKMAPTHGPRRDQMKVAECYEREVFMYESVINEYNQLHDEFYINKALYFNFIPKMYFSSLTDNHEFIIFEDLKQKNFKIFNRYNQITFAHSKMAIQQLAKFHAMSFVLKKYKSDIFERMLTEIRLDNLFTKEISSVSIEFAKKYINRTIKVISENDSILNQADYLTKLEFIRENFNELCVKLVDGKSAEPHAVICHGDFWNNNILYKVDETGTPLEAKLLDFQLSRYSSPVLDLLHYLFVCTEKSLRDEHFEDFKRIYHESLTGHLNLFNLDSAQIFPFSKLEEHLKKFGVYGICIAVFAVPFYISDLKDLPNLDKVAEAVEGLSTPLETEESDKNSTSSGSSSSDLSDRTNELLNSFDLLNKRTMPIFEDRMLGICLDLDKYDMFNVKL